MKRSALWWASLGLGVGALLLLVCKIGGDPQAAVRRPDRPALAAPRPAQRESPGVLYARAARYADCEQAGLDDAPPPPLEPSEDMPADSAVQALHETCRQIGPAQYAEVQRLMRTAADGGDAEARVYLLQRRAGALLERLSARADEAGNAPLSAADRREADLIAAELEELAFAGQRDAMQALQQMMDANVLASAEPLYAAAWRLAAAQPAGQPLRPDAPLAGEEELDTLDEPTEREVVTLARELHARCCAR